MEYENESAEPESPMDERIGKGWTLLESGDVDGARELAGLVLEEGEPDADALLLKAACEREDGDDEAALEVLAEAIKQDPEWATPRLWTAELLLLQGRGVEALKHARAAVELADDEDEFLAAVIFRSTLELESDNPAAAKAGLEELPPADVLAGTPEMALEAAELHLALGQTEKARALAQAVVDANEDEEAVTDAWYTLGLVEESAGDEKAKRRAWLKVHDADAKAAEGSEGFVADEDEVAAMAESAVEELPVKARKLLKNVPILIADFPSREEVTEGLDPRLLGLFRGTPLPETETLGAAPALTQIVLYRHNLQRVAPDDASLAEEVRTTLLHETGHFFGLDEEELAAMGLD
ncbi:MAG: metallopeptidase family protein [Deltaproteobacteria bacterium]|nr:metallopeptidase family protein [Deltaproteobacteria bacterium]